MPRRFRLIAGNHAFADKTQPPNDKGRYPVKTINIGEVLETDEDMIEKHGASRWVELTPGRERAGLPRERGTPGEVPHDAPPAVAPHGQVASGVIQEANPTASAPVTGHATKEDSSEGETAGASTPGDPSQNESETIPPPPADAPKSVDLDKDYGKLENQTVDDLHQIAAEEGLTVPATATHKADIIKALRDATKARAKKK